MFFATWGRVYSKRRKDQQIAHSLGAHAKVVFRSLRGVALVQGAGKANPSACAKQNPC
jgi:hypothetical protein